MNNQPYDNKNIEETLNYMHVCTEDVEATMRNCVLGTPLVRIYKEKILMR